MGSTSQLSAVLTHRVDRRRCEIIKSIGIPILIVGAKQDKLIDVVNSRILRKKLDSTMTTYVELDAGHVVIRECLNEVLDYVKKNIDNGLKLLKKESIDSMIKLNSNL